MTDNTQVTGQPTPPEVPADWQAVQHGATADGKPIWDVFPVGDMTAGGWLVPHAFQPDKWVPVRRVSKARYWAEAQSRADILIAHELSAVMGEDDWEAYCEDDIWGTPLTMDDAVGLVTTEPGHCLIRFATRPQETNRG